MCVTFFIRRQKMSLSDKGLTVAMPTVVWSLQNLFFYSPGNVLHQILAYWVILHAFCRLLFCCLNHFKKKFWNIIIVSDSLDPDQARYLKPLKAESSLNFFRNSYLKGGSGYLYFQELIFSDCELAYICKMVHIHTLAQSSKRSP